MRRLPIAAAVLVAATVLACSSDGEPPSTSHDPVDLEPAALVTSLMEAIVEGRFEDTSVLTDTRQAALLTLAEGADASDVVEAMEDGGEVVTANFWSGFAQTLDDTLQPGDLETEEGERLSEGEAEFATVIAHTVDGEERVFFLRRDEHWKVDLLATFGPTLADRLLKPVETLLSSANANAQVVLGHYSDNVRSLQVAATSPTLPPEAHQPLIALIERIRRAG